MYYENIRIIINDTMYSFEEIVELYTPKLFNMAYYYVQHKQDAEDIVQETFFKLFRHIEQYNIEYKFSSWLYQITKHISYDYLRVRKNRALKNGTLYYQDPKYDNIMDNIWRNEITPESQYIVKEADTAIKNAIQTLPEKYKNAVSLRYVKDLTLTEISDQMKVPMATIKTQAFRGREIIRRKLAKSM